jgi:hypothetical protein|tara:strand:+ start:126 stop:1544 length:1419 start_codon:yes stop_codon:yes gene_type:complete
MPLTDLGNPFVAAGVTGASLGGSSFPSAYDFAKRFVNTKNISGSGGNGVTSLDDPTYLGFSLLFDITSPLFNGATTGNPGITDGEQSPAPSADGEINVAFGSRNEITQSSGGSSFPVSASAIGYLNKIGEAQRAEYLKAFIQGLQEIVNTRPYYFQTIGGLVEGWGKSINFSEDPYTGSTANEGIAIGCLEAIDLKMTALFNLYRLACYDVRMKRFVLPKNLMRFSVYVSVHEIRKFKTVIKTVGAENQRSGEATTADHVNENTSEVKFKFSECIFDSAASGKVFDGVTNVGGNITTTEMKWSYGVLEMISQFSGFSSALAEDKQQKSTSPGMSNKTKNFFKDKLSDVKAAGSAAIESGLAQIKAAPGNIQDLARDRANSALQSAILGNVFGLGNQILSTLQNPQGLVNAALGAAVQAGGLGPSGPGNIKSTLGDSVFDPSTSTLGNLKPTSAFGAPGPSPDGGLSSTNIFN